MIALLLRDLRLATRAGGGFGLGLVFFLIVVVLVPFGVGPETAILSQNRIRHPLGRGVTRGTPLARPDLRA